MLDAMHGLSCFVGRIFRDAPGAADARPAPRSGKVYRHKHSNRWRTRQVTAVAPSDGRSLTLARLRLASDSLFRASGISSCR